MEKKMTLQTTHKWLAKALVDGQNSNFADRLLNRLYDLRMEGVVDMDSVVSVRTLLQVLLKVDRIQDKAITKYVNTTDF